MMETYRVDGLHVARSGPPPGEVPGVSIASSRITCPVLSVTAGFDGTSVPKDGALAEYYGGEHIHDAENGHDLMLEAGWEALLERILDWVTRRVGKL